MTNRRKDDREKTFINAQIIVDDQTISGIVEDISYSGLLLRTKMIIPKYKTIQVRLSESPSGPLLQGDVVRIEKMETEVGTRYLLGVALDKKTPKEKKEKANDNKPEPDEKVEETKPLKKITPQRIDRPQQSMETKEMDSGIIKTLNLKKDPPKKTSQKEPPVKKITGADEKDRRKHERKLTNLRVDYRQQWQTGRGKALDISAGGILLRSDHYLRIGSIIEVQLFTKKKIVSLKGKVIHSRNDKKGNFLSGIMFLKDEKK